MTKPYNLMLHYDPQAVTTVMVGTGSLMHPVCGQSEEIGVTPRKDLVECLKCKAILEKENVSESPEVLGGALPGLQDQLHTLC